MGGTLSIETPCKTNLFLAVEGRMPDGYHLISTLFVPVLDGPRDTVSIDFDAPPGIAFESSNAELSGQGNLCCKAAKAYFDAAHSEASVCIKLEKRIPVAAGLGGGSSDAAATLLLLNRKLALFDAERLREIAVGLGADVPFFLDPRPSQAGGVGELLEPLTFEAALPPLLIAFPRFPISAAWAYKNLDWAAARADSRSIGDAIDALRSADFVRSASLLRNDLSHAVRAKFPLIGMIERSLLDAGALGAQVSGSGSSVFGAFRSASARDEARAFFKNSSDWQGVDAF